LHKGAAARAADVAHPSSPAIVDTHFDGTQHTSIGRKGFEAAPRVAQHPRRIPLTKSDS
jgi:hypothetical protein